jgi:hypothetical protein
MSGTRTSPIAGRIVLTIAALFMAVATYVADWNASHIYNPHWPPHAKFHNGQTMAMAIVLALLGLFFVWRRRGDARSNVLAGALVLAVYWVTQALANLYPGVGWTDPEFLKPGQSLTGMSPQLVLDMVFSVVLAIGWALARRGAPPSPVSR